MFLFLFISISCLDIVSLISACKINISRDNFQKILKLQKIFLFLYLITEFINCKRGNEASFAVKLFLIL